MSTDAVNSQKKKGVVKSITQCRHTFINHENHGIKGFRSNWYEHELAAFIKYEFFIIIVTVVCSYVALGDARYGSILRDSENDGAVVLITQFQFSTSSGCSRLYSKRGAFFSLDSLFLCTRHHTLSS